MISPNMILRPLYHIENENQSQNPARSIVSNSLFFGTVNQFYPYQARLCGQYVDRVGTGGPIMADFSKWQMKPDLCCHHQSIPEFLMADLETLLSCYQYTCQKHADCQIKPLQQM